MLNLRSIGRFWRKLDQFLPEFPPLNQALLIEQSPERSPEFINAQCKSQQDSFPNEHTDERPNRNNERSPTPKSTVCLRPTS